MRSMRQTLLYFLSLGLPHVLLTTRLFTVWARKNGPPSIRSVGRVAYVAIGYLRCQRNIRGINRFLGYPLGDWNHFLFHQVTLSRIVRLAMS